jgi:hypothetical protein
MTPLIAFLRRACTTSPISPTTRCGFAQQADCDAKKFSGAPLWPFPESGVAHLNVRHQGANRSTINSRHWFAQPSQRREAVLTNWGTERQLRGSVLKDHGGIRFKGSVLPNAFSASLNSHEKRQRRVFVQ